MPRHYSPAEKSTALARLAENRGKITLTALQLGIAERTLRHWRHQIWVKEEILPVLPMLPPTPPANRQNEELPHFENDLEMVNFMRRQMLDDLLAISLQLRQDFAYATPYQRLLIIPQLLDRLMKLDERLRPYQPKEQMADQPFEIDCDIDEVEEDRLDFLLLRKGSENTHGPYSAEHLLQVIESDRHLGYETTIQVNYSRGVSDDDANKPEWSGILTLT